MKKNLLRGLFAACLLFGCTWSASAELLFTEDFNYSAGEQLSIGTEASTAQWSSFSGSTNYILVKDTNLLFPGYAESETTKSVELFWGSRADDLHKFADVTSGDVYLSALVHIDTLKNATADYFLTLGDASSSGMYARVYTKANNTKDSVQFAITKYSESTSYLNWTEQKYEVGSTILLVAKYSFVDGEKNDTAYLYINPTPSITEPAYTIACKQDAVSGSGAAQGANSKTDASKIASVNLRQGTNTPQVIVDAIRVATTWAELFGGEEGGEEEGGGETEATPMLECGVLTDGELAGYVQLDGAVVGEEITCTLHIAGKDLKGDITLAADHADILSINPSSVSKADAEAGGKEVIVTIKPSSPMFTQYNITASSEGAEDFQIAIYCMAQQPPYQSLQAFIDAFAGEESSSYDYTVKNDMVVTHVFDQNGIWCAYIQDETAGLRVYDDYGSMQSYKTGDRIEELTGTLELSYGVYSINTTYAPSNPTVVSNSPAEPIAIGIADMPNYVGRLVRINGVAIATAENETTITAGEATSELTTFSGSDVEIAALPTEADIIGIVRSANATVRRISPRSKADIIGRVASDINNTTAAHIYAGEGALHIQGAEAMHVEVLNVAGQTILAETFAAGTHSIALDGGLYVVKVNGLAQKLIVR